MTAWEALFEVGDLTAGQRVLVNGAAGGLGGYAVQLARHVGAEVAATCRAPNHEYVAALGAQLLIDYRTENVTDAVLAWAPEGVDLVVDAVGQGSLPDAVALTRSGGRIAPIGTLIPGQDYDLAEAERRSVRVVPTMSNYGRTGQHLRNLVALVANGAVRAPHLEVLPLADAAEALDRVQTGHVRGKLVLEVAGGE